ncbi:fk506-binding protein [Anaeramoeba flamelloides]|uniref:peptidylprolyl isomerase n=1 Tax=Anaeramoeba flamelloides TaxID=1746091 RepID=A0ABQ8Y0Q8_9EUKA|nr:fk506-binding protein [Anaeramoeba flamelloides]
MTENMIDILGNGGIMKEILKEGSGEKPLPNSTVKVHYVGTLTNGKKFDSSRDRDQPFEFVVGKRSVIQGWDLGIPTMKIGELAKFTIKADYAYGSQSPSQDIPPNSTLIFEVELLGFESPETWDVIFEKCLKKKELGNQKFKEGKWQEAENEYHGAIHKISEIPTSSLNEEEAKKVTDLTLVIHLNSAMAMIKTGNFHHALSHCSQALAIDPKNTKALYRKAICLGSESDFEGAISTLKFGLDVDPNNGAMKSKLKFYMQKKNDEIKRKREMYQRMFQKK